MAATPPLAALQVASATYFHLECSHPELFHAEYKRSNRTKGLKILRCFPHCCPEHIDRSYCGTSLSLRVELEARSSDAALTDPPSSEILAVFARFEAVSDVSLRPGEYVEVDRMTAGTQSDNNLEGQWVAATLDRPSRLVTTIRPPGTPSDDQKPLVFHLNGKPFSRWYYDWESGANKTQRLMKHVLKTYIVECCAVDQDGNFTAYTSRQAYTQLYRVLDVVSSPEFTVISYRRSTSEKYQMELLPSLLHGLSGDGASPYMESHVYDGKPIDHGHSRSRLYAASRTPFQSPAHATSSPREYQADFQRVAVYPAPIPSSSDANDLLKDKLRWEHANMTFVTVSRNLALVYSFLQWAPLSVYASSVDNLIHQSLLEAFSGAPNEISRLNCLSKFLLEQMGDAAGTAVASPFLHGDHFPGGAPLTRPCELKIPLHVLAKALTWFFSTDTRQWIRAFFRQYAGSVLDKHALRACFVLFIQELQDRLNTNVFARSELRSLETVAEEVITAVYSNECFRARRPQTRDILSGQNFVGWNAFVAQMRETYINTSKCPGVQSTLLRGPRSDLNFDQAHPPRNSVESAWNADWLLDVDGTVWKPREEEAMKQEVDAGGDFRGSNSAVSLFSLFEIISQIVRVEVAIEVQARKLHVRSTQGIAGVLDCMSLVLDGKERVFSTFPNGMASSIDGGRSGDYIGEMQVDQSGRLVVYLQVFHWSVRDDRPSYHLRARIECWCRRRLCVSGDVLATTVPFSFYPEEASCLGEMPLRHKREAVSRSFAEQIHENTTANWNTVAPWKELGRFRLSYLKV